MRWWLAAVVYLAAAPLPPLAAVELVAERGPTLLSVAVLAGVTAVACLLGGVVAVAVARGRCQRSRPAGAGN